MYGSRTGEKRLYDVCNKVLSCFDFADNFVTEFSDDGMRAPTLCMPCRYDLAMIQLVSTVYSNPGGLTIPRSLLHM